MKQKPAIATIAFLLFIASCNVSNQTIDHDSSSEIECFENGVDSIQVIVSSKVGGTRNIMLKDNGEAVARFENKPDQDINNSIALELVSLADSLFVEKTHKIVLSKEDASGRTDYPIFNVTLYRGDKEETTRYDMGKQEGNITHCTTCDIHYSPEFRHFVSQVFEILER